MKYVSCFKDRHGKSRYRFRRVGGLSGYFKSEYGTADFDEEYLRFLKGEPRIRIKFGPTPKRKFNGGPHIYFINAGRRVKIGWTTNLNRRMKELQIGSHVTLTVLAAVPGTEADERALHEWFKPLNAIGEWHYKTPRLVAAIEAIRAANCLPDLSTLPEQ